MRLAICLALALATCNGLRAQETGVIWGTVTDAAWGDGLIGANVIVSGAVSVGATTDIDGRYRIENVPGGPLTIQASYAGYRRVVIDTVLVADSLRLDFVLQVQCLDEVSLSVVEYPPGTVYDLPAIDARWAERVARESRPIETVAPEPLAARTARTAAWDRGADALGRWRPAMRSLGRPQAYVGGLPVLSLDAVPVGSADLTGAFAGYLPARYGGSAAGAAVVEVQSGGLSEVFAGAEGERAGVALRHSYTRSRTDPNRCYALIERTSVAGEAEAAVGRGAVQGDGRALVHHVWRPARLVAHARADVTSTAFGDGGSVGAVAGVRSDSYEPLLLTLGVDHGWRLGDASTVVAGRAEANWETLRSHDDVQLGVEASARSGADATGPGAAAVSSVAVYGERQFYWSPRRLRRSILLTTGGRVERFGLDGGGVWTVQPRVQIETTSNNLSVYLYGVRLSAPGADGALWHRTEAGGGARSEVLGWGSPVRLTAGAQGYVRSVDGARRGEVVGLDASATAAAEVQPYGGLEVTLRSRTEWGDDVIARDRVTAALQLWISQYEVGQMLGGTYRAFVDVADGVGGRSVVEVGGEATPWWLGAAARGIGVQRPLSLHGRGVVAGRDAVPCADGLGAIACPAPVVEVALRVGL